jgi:hypothetical protein
MARRRVTRYPSSIAARGRHFEGPSASKEMMPCQANYLLRQIGFAFAVLLAPALFAPLALHGQEPVQGPLPTPAGRTVHRVESNAPNATAPPMAPEEIIKQFARKEDQYKAARPNFTYSKSIKLTEYGPDGQASGEYELTTTLVRASDGKLYEKIIGQPQNTLHYLKLEPEDVEILATVPAYPLTTDDLAKYDITYKGKQKIDEIDTYIFEVHPKQVDRAHPYFDGVVWVDAQYLEVVKTYGKWVTDLGDVHSPLLPFTNFETYREHVEGKYWLPDYSRSDDMLHTKERDVPIRVVIKWTDFKPLAPAQPAAGAPVAKPQS